MLVCCNEKSSKYRGGNYLDILGTLADDAHQKGALVNGERWMIYLDFLSEAEATKLSGKPIDICSLSASHARSMAWPGPKEMKPDRVSGYVPRSNPKRR